MTIRTLIVDDEPSARKRLRSFLATEADFEIVGECAGGLEAVAKTRILDPQLLFLDIKMPDLDGFGVVEALGAENMPATIFVTAHDQYALRAFECHAIDYLVKPLDRNRVREALRNVLKHVGADTQTTLSHRLSSPIEDLKAEKSGYLYRLTVKSAGRLVLLRAEDIDWIDAAGNYVWLNTHKERFRLRARISELERKLDPKQFVRIHRSTIVNSSAIREIQSSRHGEGVVVLLNGQRLSLSRAYREKLASHLT